MLLKNNPISKELFGNRSYYINEFSNTIEISFNNHKSPGIYLTESELKQFIKDLQFFLDED